MDKIFNHEPADFEIEKDVAILKTLLSDLGEDDKGFSDEPSEAYFQNFLYNVHSKIQEPKKVSWFERFWKPTAMLALPTLIIFLFFSFKSKNFQNNIIPNVVQNVESYIFPFSNFTTQANNVYKISTSENIVANYNASSSLILDKRQLKMLKAIINEDENGVIDAITDEE